MTNISSTSNNNGFEQEGSVKSRLIEWLRFKRMSQSELARELGVSPTYVAAMRKSLSNDRLRRLLEIFPDLNRDWLLYGEGEMQIDAPEEVSEIPEDLIVPLLPVEAFAGRLQDWSAGVKLSECEKIISPIPGADLAICITGNSMEPVFHNGSTLLIKRINEKAFIPWGTPMVVDTENGALVKSLYPVKNRPGEDEEFIEARSFNPDYPNIYIPAESIYGLYRILAQLQSYTTI